MQQVIAEIDAALRSAASPAFALSVQRFFTHPVSALGVPNGVVGSVARAAFKRHPGADWPAIADQFARSHAFNEYFLLAAALMAHVVRSPDPDGRLFAQMRCWLDSHASNWAQCDDLCIKPLFVYLKRHPARRAEVIGWGAAASPWSRRASNVALVKLVGRVDGFELDAVLANCKRLLGDPDPYVQKGIGWMLKVALGREQEAVLAFLRAHRAVMQASTLRYALEKMPAGLD